jgi:outer membrane protein TolC
MAHQLQDLDARLPALKEIAAAAERNFRQGNLDAATYVSLKSNFLAQQSQAIRMRAALARAHAALEILLGLPFNFPSSAEGFEQRSPAHD